MVQANRIKLSALTSDDWDVLRALHHVLKGFDIATTIISSSHYPTLADSFWAVNKLRRILIPTKDDCRYIELLKMTALNYLNAYTEKHSSNVQQQGMLVNLRRYIPFHLRYFYFGLRRNPQEIVQIP